MEEIRIHPVTNADLVSEIFLICLIIREVNKQAIKKYTESLVFCKTFEVKIFNMSY